MQTHGAIANKKVRIRCTQNTFTTNTKHVYPERVCLIETRKVHQEHEGRCDYACAVPAESMQYYSRCGQGLHRVDGMFYKYSCTAV